MSKTKHELPDKTRAAEQLRDRHGYSPGGSRRASIILSQLQNAPARKPTSSRLLKNPPFTLRQAQGERSRRCNRWRFAVRAEPVEARKRLFQHSAKSSCPNPGFLSLSLVYGDELCVSSYC